MALNGNELNCDPNQTLTIDYQKFEPLYSGNKKVEFRIANQLTTMMLLQKKICLTYSFATEGVNTIVLDTG